MKIGVVGTGYVGLVTGTCLAETGHDVTCVDIDQAKIARLQRGQIPIHEPGLQELFDRNVQEGRLHFATDLSELSSSKAIFLALPTPSGKNGAADLSFVYMVAAQLGEILTGYTLVVNKSTVPVGTAAEVHERIEKRTKTKFDVVSNPEFLREGQAVNDFMDPDRVVVGSSSPRAIKLMWQLYKPLLRKNPEKFLVTDEASAEISKYAANAFLATKISFVNELSRLCEKSGADIEAVRTVMGTDHRIGPDFLYAGPGYGGSCFPKDTLAILQSGREYGVELNIIASTIKANQQQKGVLTKKILDYYQGDIKERTIALWGLAFKDNTDDIRESPATELVTTLTNAGAHVVAFDPQAMDNFKKNMPENPNLSFADGMYEVLNGAEALVIVTNWKEFFGPEFTQLKRRMKTPIIFDGRNLFDLETMKAEGFHYESIGRSVTSND